MALRFDGRVAVVTGAGGGLGRSYALLLSSLGAKVVVNDLGGSLTGGQQGSSRPADVVVDEIRRNGGVAVANYDSVEHGERIVATAIQNFGRIDILINNAGILRDRSLTKMTAEDWDLIMAVHLKGSFNCTRAAWPHMQSNRYGRIVNTASAAGLYGNFGQANYSSAKLGLVGLTKSTALEGASKNIHANVVAPLAGTRMTETIMPKELVDALRPDYIAPIVAWLVHEDCQDNGEVMECGAGWVSKLRWQRTRGKIFPKGFTVDDVRQDWNVVSDFSKDVTYPSSMQDSLMLVSQSLDSEASQKPSPQKREEPLAANTKTDKLFSLMNAYLVWDNGSEGSKLVKRVGAKYLWKIQLPSNDVIVWTVDLKSGTGYAQREECADADAIFTMRESDFIDVCLGKLNPQIAFIRGKMKIKGNMKAATKFTASLFPKIAPDLLECSVDEAINNYLKLIGKKSMTSKSETKSTEIRGTGLKSEHLVNMIRYYIQTSEGQKLIDKVGASYQFEIRPSKDKPPVPFSIQLKQSPASMEQGTLEKPDATFTIDDDDFVSMMKGTLNPQIAFVQGKMKIKGNMKAAMRFTPDLFPKPSNL